MRGVIGVSARTRPPMFMPATATSWPRVVVDLVMVSLRWFVSGTCACQNVRLYVWLPGPTFQFGNVTVSVAALSSTASTVCWLYITVPAESTLQWNVMFDSSYVPRFFTTATGASGASGSILSAG